MLLQKIKQKQKFKALIFLFLLVHLHKHKFIVNFTVSILQKTIFTHLQVIFPVFLLVA